MESVKQAVFGSTTVGRWRRVAVALTVALLLLGAVHLSPKGKVHAAGESVGDRSRRSASSTPSVRNATPTPAGAVYTHWGRHDCPSSAQIVYKGTIGSDHYTHTGGGVEYLCLAEEPEWLATSVTGYSHMYGVEYQNNHVGMTAGQKAVCTVCQSTRTNKVMIPGRTSCVNGWTREYYGYLMSAKHAEKKPHNYICVDKNAHADRASNGRGAGGRLYHVLAICGALPCPKYKRSLMTCVLCTR